MTDCPLTGGSPWTNRTTLMAAAGSLSTPSGGGRDQRMTAQRAGLPLNQIELSGPDGSKPKSFTPRRNRACSRQYCSTHGLLSALAGQLARGIR
jgi:hypothetical protein